MKFAAAAIAQRTGPPGFLAGSGRDGGAARLPAGTSALLEPVGDRSAPDPDAPELQSWVRYDDLTWIAALDRTGRKLQGAWHALANGEQRIAEFKMRALAADLRDWSLAAVGENAALTGTAQRRAQSASWRLAASAVRAGLAAAGIATGEIRTLETLRRVLDHASVLDMDTRWRFVDHTVWYPLSGATQRHFARARRAAAVLDGATASTEMLKAAGFLRLEAARADGNARNRLDAAIANLQELARGDGAGSSLNVPATNDAFLSAMLALALAHRNRAAESWLRGDRYRAGYDFMAAGENLGNALCWVDDRNRLTPSMVPMDIAVLGRRLVAGDAPRRSDVLDAIQSFGTSLEAMRGCVGME